MRRNRPDTTALQAMPIYAGAKRRQLEQLAPHADIVCVPAGTVLAAEGQTAHQVVTFVDGEAAGMVVGAREVVTGEPYERTIVTRSNSTVVVIPAAAFRWSAAEVSGVRDQLDPVA